MKTFTRADRVGELVRQNLSDILLHTISDPRLASVTITGVRMSADIKLARIYFVTGTGKKAKADAVAGFKKASGYIKRILGKRLALRYVPALRFYYNESLDYGEHIDTLLGKIPR